MCKLAHVIRYTVLSQNSHFAVLERWLINDCETECSFVYVITVINVQLFVDALFPSLWFPLTSKPESSWFSRRQRMALGH